ncbi:MAG: ribonuclease HII [Bacillota bacterium]|jgi:ribonuclease HII
MPRMRERNSDLERARHLYDWESSMRRKYRYIAGVDEVGRGPMAGPVVAAAVILPAEPAIPGINDSKRLTPKKREEVFDLILEHSLAYGIGVRSSKFVDEKGIVEATYSAMRMAVAALTLHGVTPELVLVDGYPIKGLSLRQEAVVHGDSTSASVAGASILAKVTRDRIMAEYEGLYPGYGFREHKGYCTSSHRSFLQALGPSPIHRRSFAPVSMEIDGAADDLETDEA